MGGAERGTGVEVALSADGALEGVGLRNILVILRLGDPGLAITGVFATVPAVGVIGVSAVWIWGRWGSGCTICPIGCGLLVKGST